MAVSFKRKQSTGQTIEEWTDQWLRDNPEEPEPTAAPALASTVPTGPMTTMLCLIGPTDQWQAGVTILCVTRSWAALRGFLAANLYLNDQRAPDHTTPEQDQAWLKRNLPSNYQIARCTVTAALNPIPL